MDPSFTNATRYSEKRIIEYYKNYSDELQLPEKTIIALLQPGFPIMRMLDIGVGAGRTTPFFVPYVKSYLGIDFSEGMVRACIDKYGSVYSAAKFEMKDVRDLSEYEDKSFDFIFFSFNGLDNITHEEQMKVLPEIRRLLSTNGYFCFSSHNIQSLPEFFRIRFRWHPVKFLRSVLYRNKLINRNQEALQKLSTADYLLIYDDVYDFGLFTYYSRPSYQLSRLTSAGFKSIRPFSLKNGREILDPVELKTITDSWIYYLCS